MIWRLDIEMIAAKGFITFIRVYFLFRSERLSTNIKLALYKASMRSMMYAWLFGYSGSSWQTSIFFNCSICKTAFFASLVTFQGTH